MYVYNYIYIIILYHIPGIYIHTCIIVVIIIIDLCVVHYSIYSQAVAIISQHQSYSNPLPTKLTMNNLIKNITT